MRNEDGIPQAPIILEVTSDKNIASVRIMVNEIRKWLGIEYLVTKKDGFTVRGRKADETSKRLEPVLTEVNLDIVSRMMEAGEVYIPPDILKRLFPDKKGVN